MRSNATGLLPHPGPTVPTVSGGFTYLKMVVGSRRFARLPLPLPRTPSLPADVKTISREAPPLFLSLFQSPFVRFPSPTSECVLRREGGREVCVVLSRGRRRHRHKFAFSPSMNFAVGGRGRGLLPCSL